jgi:hypothetical protein
MKVISVNSNAIETGTIYCYDVQVDESTCTSTVIEYYEETQGGIVITEYTNPRVSKEVLLEIQACVANYYEKI